MYIVDFFSFFCFSIPKYRSLSWKPRSHVRILIYQDCQIISSILKTRRYSINIVLNLSKTKVNSSRTTQSRCVSKKNLIKTFLSHPIYGTINSYFLSWSLICYWMSGSFLTYVLAIVVFYSAFCLYQYAEILQKDIPYFQGPQSFSTGGNRAEGRSSFILILC